MILGSKTSFNTPVDQSVGKDSTVLYNLELEFSQSNIMALASASQRGTQSCFARALPFQALAPLTGLDPRAGNARCLFCSSGCSTLFPALFFNCCPCSQFGLRPFPGNSIREVPSSAGNSIWCKILESSLIFWAQLNLMLNWDKIPPAYLNLIL